MQNRSYIIILLLLILVTTKLSFFRHKQQLKLKYFTENLNVNTNNENSTSQGLNLNDTLQSFSGKTLHDKYIDLNELDASFFMIIFFNSNDCIDCLAEIPLWNLISASYPEELIKIIGVGNGISKNNFDNFLATRKIKFDVIFDEDDSIKSMMKISQTPLRIITDSRLKILDIEKPNSKFLMSDLVQTKLEKLIRYYNEAK